MVSGRAVNSAASSLPPEGLDTGVSRVGPWQGPGWQHLLLCGSAHGPMAEHCRSQLRTA